MSRNRRSGLPLRICSTASRPSRARASQFYSSLLLQQVEQTAARRQFVVSGELTIARKEMATAHNRLNDYLSRGIVPDDLAKNGRHLGG